MSSQHFNLPMPGRIYHNVFCFVICTGKGKPSDITEHSGLAVETVEKKAGESSKKKSFKGDASKVIAKGNGLKKAFSGSAGNFTVDIKGAGEEFCMR